MDSNRKKILISGSEGQLGKAIVKILASRQCDVVGIDIHDKTSNRYLSSYHQIDISEELEVIGLFKNEPDVDCLINNAGIGVFTPTLQRTVEEFRSVMEVNLLGTFLMAQNFIKSKKKDGRIVNIASMYGHVSSDFRIYGKSGRNNSEVYTATKAGVIALTKYLATHFSHLNFTVNSVSPGGIFNAQTEFFLQEYKKKSPQARLSGADEVANLVTYLSLDSPSHLTGEDILIDGGFTKW